MSARPVSPSRAANFMDTNRYDRSASPSAVLDSTYHNNRSTSASVTQRSDSAFVNSIQFLLRIIVRVFEPPYVDIRPCRRVVFGDGSENISSERLRSVEIHVQSDPFESAERDLHAASDR